MATLRDQYDGVEAVLADVTVVTSITGRIHRPAADAEPWCNSTSDTEYVETAIALEYGAELCLNCYGAALEHLARAEETPVEHAGNPPETPPPAEVDVAPVEEEDTGEDDKLDAITAEALVGTGGASTFHAPAGGGVALCGEEIDGTRRRIDHTPPSARPCRRCFAEEIVEAYAPRDADLATVAEAATDGGRF